MEFDTKWHLATYKIYRGEKEDYSYEEVTGKEHLILYSLP